MAAAALSELRIVLLGWTDSGKTSSANTILGRSAFSIEKGTEECEKCEGFVDERQVTVVDTQGWKRIASLTFFKKEIVRGVELCPPGPHALLLVMRLDKDVETKSLQELLGLLSMWVWNCTIVLFTHGDAVGEMTDLERHIQKKDVYKELLEKCGNRYHVFDNNERGRDQVTELLKKIDEMVEGNTERFLPSKEIHEVFITLNVRQRRTSKEQPPSMKDEASESKSPSEEKSDVTETTQKGPQAEGTEGEETQNAETGGTPGAKRRNSIDKPPSMPPASPGEPELRLVLLGRTGSGKSAAANTILGKEVFVSQASSSPVTQETDKNKRVIAGRKVAIVDTPDWFTLGFSKKQIEDDVGLCYSLSSPGPHAFLLVVPVGRYIDREREELGRMLKIFGKDSLGHTMILFTHGDELKDRTIEEFIQTGTEDLKWLIEQCGHRYHVLNNHVLKDNPQVKELLGKVDEMIDKHSGSSYSSEKYRAVESHIINVKRRLLMEWRGQKNSEEEEVLMKNQKEMKNIKEQLNECKQRLEQREKEIEDLKEELRKEREENKETKRLLREAEEGKRQEEIKLKELEESYRKVKESYDKIVEMRQAQEEAARDDAERHSETPLKLDEITAESITAAQQLRAKEEERKRLETEMDRMRETCHEKDREIEGLRQMELEKDREIEGLRQMELEKNRETDRLRQIEVQKDKEMDRLRQSNEKQKAMIKRLQDDLESARTIATQATAMIQESKQSSRGESREEQTDKDRDSFRWLREVAQRLATLQEEISGDMS